MEYRSGPFKMHLFALDPYSRWDIAALKAAADRGWQTTRLTSSAQVAGIQHFLKESPGEGYGFMRLSMEPKLLPQNRIDYAQMAARLTMVQDPTQIRVYEDKSAQFELWSEWMPDTWRFTDHAWAQAFAAQADYPLVSKADTGASSMNVRILQNAAEAERHIFQAFSAGVKDKTGRGATQKGYVLLQRFIPHKTTYRVNALGDARAIFFRHCYPDRPVAQTGNVDPATEMTEELESLLEFSDRFFDHARTKWCAIDVLKDGNQWRLLETSEAWPWPSPGTCNEAPIFRSSVPRKWIEMFEVMCDEIERGAFVD